MDADVLVVGAGPVGLLLASELALGGVRVLVLERRADLTPEPIKQGEMGGRSLNAPSVHALRRRGLLRAVRDAALMWWDPKDRPAGPPAEGEPPAFAGHFAGIMLRADRIDLEDPDLADQDDGAGVIAQADLERLLGDRARELGVVIRTGVAVTDVRQTSDAVTAVTDHGPVSARWLVGCDGGRSVVRKKTGIAFPGDDAELAFRLALVDMTEPEKLLPGGMHEGKGGHYLLGGWERRLHPTRITTIEPQAFAGDRDAPMTAAELQDSIRRVCGIDTEITAIHAATRYADTTRQAETYRAGRVLLAGDAAHVHSPAGGQGLNLGISDAMNLGWKLAAVVRGEADESLLDTYTEERHPVGAWVQEWTKAQTAITRRDSRTRALHAVVTDLLETKAGTTYVLKKIAGVTLRYGLPGEHPLIGKLVPSRLATDDAATDGRFILATGDPALTELATRWPNRITTVPQSPEACSLLIRPDGIVCWADENADSARELWPAWLGHPTTESPVLARSTAATT